jgi:ATP-binding cassette subfamily C protein
VTEQSHRNTTFFHKLLYLLSKKDRWQLLGIFFLILGGTLVEALGVGIVVPFVYLIVSPEELQAYPVTQHIYTLLRIDSHEEFILWACAAIIIVFVLKNLYLTIMLYIQSWFISRKRVDLSARLFTAYMHSPYTFHLQHNSAELQRNATGETAIVCNNIIRPLLLLGTDIMVACVIALLIILADPVSFIIAVTLLGTSSFLFYRSIRKKIAEMGKKRQEQAKKQVMSINQGLGAVKEVKLLGREKHLTEIFVENVAGLAHFDRFQQFITPVPRYFNESLIVIGAMSIILSAIIRGQNVNAILPILSLFAVAGYRLLPAVSHITSSLTTIQTNKVSLDVLYNDLRMLAETTPPTSHPVPRTVSYPKTSDNHHVIVELVNVFYQYPEADTYALKGISLQVAQYTSVGIVGPSGGGKTTMVDVLLGLLTPSDGHVLVEGQDIQENPGSWQRRVGYIPQSIYLADDTIRNNVALGLPDDQINDEQVWKAIELAQMKSWIETLPDKIDTVIGERGVRLSGGQRQRIGIARALYHAPDVLVMDEATAALDNETERAFVQAINSLSGKKTMIIIAHRLSTVQNSDCLVFIKDGQIIASGTYEELLQESVDFRAMAGQSATQQSLVNDHQVS